MSTFEDERYHWRETYFILFDPSKRPRTESIRKGLLSVFPTLRIRSSRSDALGRIETLSVASYEDCAALDIVYQEGEHIAAEMDALADELVNLTWTKKNRDRIELARSCRARLDVLHFEQLVPIETPESELKPEIRFPIPSEEIAAIKPKEGPFANRPQFLFDPHHYIEPATPLIPESDEDSDENSGDDLEQNERLDPNTLILVLQLLSRLTDGFAIDPASGAVL